MESVAAERLNKLGKNPSIISTRHDLKRDAAALKDMIDRATPQPSSDSEEDSSLSSSSSLSSDNERKSANSLNKENSPLNEQRKKRKKKRSRKQRKSSSSEQKFQKLSRLFLAAPSPTSLDQNTNQLRKSPSTPWSLFRKTGSPTPSLSIHPSS